MLAGINASGAAFLTHTVTGGRYVIRVAIGSVTTAPEHVDQLWDRLRAEAGAVVREGRPSGAEPGPGGRSGPR